MRCFNEAVRIPVPPTLVGIESCPEMRLHCDTNSNAMDDELQVDIMRTVPGKISEM